MIPLLKKLFREETNNTLIQLLRYTFVGGIAFVVDFGLLVSLTEFIGIHYLISAAIAFMAGLVTNYIMSISWVFNQRSIKNKSAEFAIFGLIGLVGLAMTELIIWSATEKLLFHYIVSKIFATIIVYFFNFSVRKYVLFK